MVPRNPIQIRHSIGNGTRQNPARQHRRLAYVSCSTFGDCDLQNPALESGDFQLPGVYADLIVTEDIHLYAIGDASATMSYIDQNFNTVPEPMSIALLGLVSRPLDWFPGAELHELRHKGAMPAARHYIRGPGCAPRQ